jgi:WD40 repeat protein
MGTYSIASGSYDGHARIYDVRMGTTTVDVLAHPVTSVRCSSDGNALLASTLDGYIRLLDRMDGKLLNAFGGEKGRNEKGHSYRNSELRVRSVFAMGDAVVLSGSEEGTAGAAAFAWDVVKGEVIAAVPVGEKVKAVSCVAWNEGAGDWAAGCSDGKLSEFDVFGLNSADCCPKVLSESTDEVGSFPDVLDKVLDKAIMTVQLPSCRRPISAVPELPRATLCRCCRSKVGRVLYRLAGLWQSCCPLTVFRSSLHLT